MTRWAAAVLLVRFAFAAPAVDPRDHFESKVRPVLAKNCYSCHTQSKLGGLRLDTREAVLKGGNSGPAVVVNRPEESLLIQAVSHTHARLTMPPSTKLPAEEIQTLADWIREGAWWPPDEGKAGAAAGAPYVINAEQRAFWAFQPIRSPAPPTVKNAAWAGSAIDRFILARLEEKGLKPAPAAERRTLLRRATLDLTGLPPTPQDYDAFAADKSPNAFAKVVDRLLASPRYGERWGRHWLDVARYADDKLNSTKDEPYENAFRYRNWVIRAVNEDMPYDEFLKAQIAGDQMTASDPLQYKPGLGFFALSPEFQDERVDALTRGFLGLTVACAQCHDHKFDPIPTRDYYALQGVFASSRQNETPLADDATVAAYAEQKKRIETQEERIKRFYAQQTDLLGESLTSSTARYLLAARGVGPADGLEAESLERWKKYLAEPHKDHPYLEPWYALERANAGTEALEREAARLQALIADLIEEKRRVDQENEVRLGLGPSRSDLANANLVSLERNKYVFWRDLFAPGTKDSAGFFSTPDGVYYYGRAKIERFLPEAARAHLREQKARLAAMKKDLPPQYPFLHTMADGDKPADTHILIRGERNNKGDLAPRAFLSVLAEGSPKPFTRGSGRLELAEAVASKSNPLTARVLVNRVWLHHFGRGIVNTPGNFGQLGERPSHPELLDHLASSFMANGWSLKKLHREMMLSATYQLSAAPVAANVAADPANTLFWRFQRQRMDVETIRDAMAAVAGTLDAEPAALPLPLDGSNRKRTVYARVSRRKPDAVLSLFDFPNPNSTSERRIPTNIPSQRLFFMNSPFVEQQAKALADRLSGDDRARVEQAYRLVYGRTPTAEEARDALAFVATGSWTEYARVLLSSNEFLFVD